MTEKATFVHTESGTRRVLQLKHATPAKLAMVFGLREAPQLLAKADTQDIVFAEGSAEEPYSDLEPGAEYEFPAANSGNAWQNISDPREAISYHEQELQVKRSIHGEDIAHPDIATSLDKLGVAWRNLGDHKKAIRYHEQALQMMRTVYGQNTAQPDIASSLYSVGVAWNDIGDHRKAIMYYEEALKMMRQIYGEDTAHPNIASSLDSLGVAWNDVGDYRKAISYQAHALQMMRTVYGQNTAHLGIASSLHNLGVAWRNLGDYKKAISYYEQALQMRRTIYGEGTVHPDIASSLDSLGVTWNGLSDYRKAISYHEQALQMWRIVYGQNTVHPDIASSLDSLGVTWNGLGDYRKAISYHQQALQMRRTIYGENTAHPVVASSLHNLGVAWRNLGDYKKAISYYEQALQMMRIVYGENTVHPDIASSLDSLGVTWNGVGDYRKAVAYHEQALQMRRIVYGEDTAHPDIATTLNNLGATWGHLGDHRKAASFHEEALQMERILAQKISSDPIELIGPPEMARLYAESCRQGSLPVHSTRVPVVGQFRSGKTCLIKRLMGEEVIEEEVEPITDGINIIADVQSKTWKKSREEIDDLAAQLLRTQQETGPSAEDEYKNDDMTKAIQQEAENIQQEAKNIQQEAKNIQQEAKNIQQGTETMQQETEGAPEHTVEVAPTEQLSHGANLEEEVQAVRPGRQNAATEEPTANIEDRTPKGAPEISKPSIPDIVIEAAEKMKTAGITEDEIGTVDHPRLSFWDFGGQATYYGTHQCFITPRGVYILVMSLEQKLSDPVPDLDHKASVDNLRTGGDYLDHWLNSVHSHTQHRGRPPVIIVLTNKDKFSKDPDYIEQYKKEVRRHIEGKASGMLVMPEIFAVDNTTDDAEVDKIRDYIRKVASKLPHMGEQIPISWLHLKSRLTKRREEGDRFLKFQEVADLARDPEINITDKHTLAMVLNFFHDRGDIIFFNEPGLRDDVTLQPQVMIDVFKTIITVSEYQQGRQPKAGNMWGTLRQAAAKLLANIWKMMGGQTGPDLNTMWEDLEQKGVLGDELLTRIWEEKDRQPEKPFLIEHKSFLTALMEKFYVICNATPISDAGDEGQQIYFVPALLSCEKDNTELYPSNMHSCPQALYFVFEEKFLPSGMFCRLQALCVRRFGLEESRVFAGCARFPTDDKEQAFVITKVNHYLKVEILSSSNIFTEGLRVRKFLSSALFEIKEKWIPCIQYELCCSTQEDGGEIAFRALQTGEESPGQRWGFPPLFRAVWMSEGPQSDHTENSGGDGPVIILPKGDPRVFGGMRTIGPVLDTMEQGGGLTLDQCDHIRSQLTPVQRVQTVLEMKARGKVEEYLLQLGAAVEMCLPEFEDLFRREKRGKEVVVLHTDDYTAEFVSPLQTAMDESGVPCHTEIITSSDSITVKTVDLLLNTNNRMVLPVISPQTLHHNHRSNLAYEFSVRNEKLLLPILLYPRGSRDQMVRVLQRRAPVLCSMEREEIEMKGGLVSKRKLGDILQKVMIDEKEEARLYRIVKAVGEEWTRLGQELGLEKSILDEIEGDDNTQTALQMLKAWRIKTPHGPLHYLTQLEEALRNIARPDLASAIHETYKEYRNGVELRELNPGMNEDKTWSLHLPGEGKYLCRRTDLGVVTPYPLHVTYRSANWSDKWHEVGEWMPVGPLVSIQCEDVEGPVDILLPHVLHLTENTEITIDDLQVVHVVGDSVELLPVTELTSSHAVTRFKKGSLFGLVGKTKKVFSVSRNCLLMAFRSLDDSDLSTLKVYIVSNTREITETLTEDEKRWNFEPCGLKTCHLSPGDLYSLEGSVTNGGSEMVSISPQHLMFEDTLDKNKFYEPFEVEVTADIWMDNTTRLYLELLKETTEEGNETQPLSQLTLGRYKRSQIAEGVDSGHSTPIELESVRRQLESARLTADDDTGASEIAEHLHRESGQAGAEAEVDVKESHIKTVLKEASSKWEELALELGFNANEIDVIRDLRPDQNQMCRKMLTEWRNREGREATLQVLKQALIDIQQGRVAELLD